MLLDEIIDILSDSKGSLTDALLKTKVLLHQIGNKDLATWVSNELTGYPDSKSVPPYRTVSSEVHGHVVSIAWQQADYLLPIQHLDAQQIEFLTKNKIQMSIESIEGAVKSYRTKGGGLRRNLPTEFTSLLQKPLVSGVNINSAWCEINMVAVENIVSEVRSRLLDFALELRGAVGADVSLSELPKRAAQVDAERLFTTAIYGGTNTLVVGSQGVQSLNVSNAKGDLDELVRTLAGLGIAQPELEQLRQAVLEDQTQGKRPDVSEGKTGRWFTNTLKKAGKGVVKAGVDVVASTIVKAIQAYTGA